MKHKDFSTCLDYKSMVYFHPTNTLISNNAIKIHISSIFCHKGQGWKALITMSKFNMWLNYDSN